MRLKTTVLIITALLIFLVQSAMAQTKAELRKITESVYSYVGVRSGTPGNVFAANAGIIIGKNAVLVVDTLTSAKEAETFMTDIKKITNKPIRYVVNTHYHLDHALGNSFFADMGVRIISHTKCRDAIIASGEKILENPAMFGLPPDFWKETRIVAPDMAFEREMVIDLGDLAVKLIYSGTKSHTAGSIMVHVPEQDALFAGDILFTDFHPYLGEGDLPGWEKNLDFIRAMNVRNIIPGHGPLSANKDLEDMKTYLTIFDKKATELSAVEKDLEKLTLAMSEVIPKRSDGDFIVSMNLKTRYLIKNESDYKSEQIESYNSAAYRDIRNSYTAAQVYFIDYSEEAIKTVDQLEFAGFKSSEGVQLTIERGTQETLLIKTWHIKGDKIYSINQDGEISVSKKMVSD